MTVNEEQSVDVGVAHVQKAIARRFNKFLIIFYVLCLVVALPITYFVTERQVFSDAEKELTLLVDMVKSVRNVVRNDTRPYFLPKGEFFPPVVSSTVMAKTVARQFAGVRPDYYIKIASDNPLNQENLPEPLETELLNHFRYSGESDSLIQTGVVKGRKYLVSAAPAKAKESCLICHGVPSDAPQAIVEKYGKINGYHWEPGTVVGTMVVGVPLEDVKKTVLLRSLYLVIILTLIFVIILITVNMIVRNVVANQMIRNISYRATGN